MTLTDQIRAGLKARKQSLNSLSRETGLQRVTLRDFLAGGLVGSKTLDAIADYLGATISIPAGSKPPAKPKKAGKPA